MAIARNIVHMAICSRESERRTMTAVWLVIPAEAIKGAGTLLMYE